MSDIIPAREATESLLAHFSERVGAQFKMNDEGICAMQEGGSFILVIEAPKDDPMMHFYSPIIELPEDAGVEIYRQILLMNTFTRRTHGCTLGLDPESNFVLMSYSELPDRLTVEDFATLVANFRQTAGELKDLLDSLLMQVGKSEEGSGTSGSLFGRKQV